ncbi:MAG: DUF3052 domain-containing protein [Candidatus Eisenbacteria bacterium]
MGREATCVARLGRQMSEGRALLESEHVLFRGAFRVKVPLSDGTTAACKDGVLTLTWREGTLLLELGDAAQKWADAIQNPKSVLDKLGVKPGQRIAVIGLRDPEFVSRLTHLLGKRPSSRAGAGCVHVLFGVHCVADQVRLASFIASIHPAGGIWAVYPRGHRAISEDSIRAAARRAGLVDVKVVRFSDTHGAVRLVIPRATR